jgi:hypothetical protein
MSNAAPATTIKSVALTLVGLLTLLCGGGYALEGGYLLLVWADWLPLQSRDLADRIVLQLDVASLVLIGGLFLAFGALAMLAALGLFLRQPWGRVLTLLVAVLAIALGLRSLELGPAIVEETTNVPLGVAQALYGILAVAVLSLNRAEPMRVYIVRLMNFLVGVPTVLFFALWVTEFKDSFFHAENAAGRDTYFRFAGLSVLSGFVAGWLLIAGGTCLLTPRYTRFAPVALMFAACAAAAVALFALLGAVLGHSGGLGEAFLLVLILPIGVVLSVLTASGAWYLTRHGPAATADPPNV